jgi:hypothetical protein
LDSIAELICGNDGPRYREYWQLPLFFRDAGWHDVPECDGYRKAWTLDRLRERRGDGAAIEKVILRLADPRAYQQDPEAAQRAVARLNSFLSLEGWRVVLEGARPKVVPVTPAMSTPASPAPAILKTDISTLVRDPQLAMILRHRLDEATTCRESGAHLCAVIMLGSVLEGVLLDFAMQRAKAACGCSAAPKDPKTKKTKPLDKWTLNEFIDVAYACGWIQHPAQKFLHYLREYRNFVHPNEQLKIGYTPNLDMVTVCLDVVNMALNELGNIVHAEAASRITL